MSCFRCFSAHEKPERAKQHPQTASKPAASGKNQQQAAANGDSHQEATAAPQPAAAASTQPQYHYPKAELDPQNARYKPIATNSKNDAEVAPGTPSKIPGSKTPAYMAIPPLASPVNDTSNKKKRGKSPSAGRVVTPSQLFVEDLPSLMKSHSFEEPAPTPPSFKGFLTDKDREQARVAVLDTADIWKPRIADTPSPLQTGATPEPSELQASAAPARLRSGDAATDEWARSLRDSQATPTASRRAAVKSASRVKGALAADGIFPTKPSTVEPIRTPPQRVPPRTSSSGSGSLSDERVRDSDSGATSTGLHHTKSGSLSGTPTQSGQVGGDLYELVGQLGVGDTGVTKLMKDRRTGELVAAKWVPHTAGEMLSVKVEREILNHRKLLHPNVVRFREVFATDEHLVIVTDYAAAGNLADRVEEEGAVPEARAKEYFRQLVDGMVYCHKLGIVHRNLRLEKLLLDGQASSPTVKISGFAYSKAPDLDSAPKSIIGGGPDFMAPEMLNGSMNGMEGATFDGRALDVWSIGVSLFTILCGSLPFKDSAEPKIMSQTLMRRIVACDYSFPSNVRLSPECKDLISRILTAEPRSRIDSYDIQNHPWLKGTTLPKSAPVVISKQSESDISSVMERARRRKEARMAKERALRSQEDHFNEDLVAY